jgi:hypothetical protein
MIKRQTIVAILTTTALAYSICTPAQAASLLGATKTGAARDTTAADGNKRRAEVLVHPRAAKRA